LVLTDGKVLSVLSVDSVDRILLILLMYSELNFIFICVFTEFSLVHYFWAYLSDNFAKDECVRCVFSMSRMAAIRHWYSIFSERCC